MTLLEVLFAILVTSVGLLGAIAVVPVALAYARKGKQADIIAVAADSCTAKLDNEFMRRPDHWLWYDAINNRRVSADFIQSVPALKAALGHIGIGQAFCIDPRFYEQNRLDDVKNGVNNSGLWAYFPAVPAAKDATGNPIAPNAVPNFGRMLRLSLHHAHPGPDGAWGSPGDANDDNDMNPNEYEEVAWQNSDDPFMTLVQANSAFAIEDELIFQRPEDESLPALQLYTEATTTAPATVRGRRQEEGRLSWIATLVPRYEGYGNVDNTYVLSIVVYYDRSPDLILSNSTQARPYTEWTAKILKGTTAVPAGDFHSQGYGGGEVTITTNANGDHADDLPNNRPNFNKADALDIKRGSWIALARTLPYLPATSGGPGGVAQYLQWYRVSGTEDAPRFDSATSRWERDVTLVGPDWPVDVYDNNTGAAGADGLADECDVIIMPGVVHVYERTIRLDVESAAQ